MFNIIFISILLIKYGIVRAHFLEAELNYQKPKLERNNIVNKGVWVKNKVKEYSNEKAILGDFIFRANSLDVDNVLQNNFDAFDENNMQDTAFITSYIKRTRRASDDIHPKGPRTSIKDCKGKHCDRRRQILEKNSGPPNHPQSKFINDLKPASVFNDYPYEVAVLLNSNEKENTKNMTKNNTDYITEIVGKDSMNLLYENTPLVVKNTTTLTNRNSSIPKRSMKYDFETELVKKFEFTENIMNKTNPSNEGKNDRNIFDKEDRAWNQNKPITGEVYKVLPKEPPKSRPVTERGLLKVITMLTKTFKKVMKQHTDIKELHNQIRDTSDDFRKKSEDITKKFEEFNTKYGYLKKFYNNIKAFEEKLAAREGYFKTKEREIANSLNEFENSQKKFLAQQRQFYNIQKLMLAQNEKINLKQSLIAKTQSEISHRQNTFARILKKAKQMFLDSKNVGATKLRLNLPKLKESKPDKDVTLTTTTESPVESVKINLFSIPTAATKLLNHDELILKDKDDQPIDDLIYKYYFNNTFIDNLMKSKVLTNFVGPYDNSINTRNAKAKRGEIETTILLPLNDTYASVTLGDLNRKRRWINHHSRHRNRRKNRGKGQLSAIINATDEKPLRNKPHDLNDVDVIAAPAKSPRKDPFVEMATNFCNELKANTNQQMLKLCIEKALRRLKYIDTAVFKPPVTLRTLSKPTLKMDAKSEKNNQIMKKMMKHDNMNTKSLSNFLMSKGDRLMMKSMLNPQIVKQPIHQIIRQLQKHEMKTHKISKGQMTEKSTRDVTSPILTTTLPYTLQTSSVFFPDNDELETNLKQYELIPDTVGNVYYDGSLHASDIGKMNSGPESDFVDDFMPGLDSNSRVEVDPLAFDVQAKRRAYLRQLNDKMKKAFG